MTRLNVRRLLLPLVLCLSLSSCATSSLPVTPPQPPKIPPPAPELLVEPDLSQSYSDLVRKLLQEWRQRLTDWKRSS